MKQRYLVITELFLPTKGGTAVWFDEVYRRIGNRSSHIVTAYVPGAEAHDEDHPNTIHRLELRRFGWMKPESLVIYLKFLFNTLRLATFNRFTAIHAGRALPEGLIAWLVGRLTFHSVVVYAHGEELTTWKAKLKFAMMKFVLRHADLVISNSNFTRQELLNLGVSLARIVVIHPGVDVERFRPGLAFKDLVAQIGLESEQCLLLSTGRLSRRKGFDSVIKSLPLVANSGLNVKYVLIGIGEDHEYLMTLAQNLGLEGHVHLLGHVETQDLARWYNACDVFVMPNRDVAGDTEGFGLVFLEAAACGKPAISGEAGGTADAVVHDKTGLRVDGESVKDIAGGITRVLTEPELAKTLGLAGCERARADFSWSAVAARIDALGRVRRKIR